MVVAQVAQLKAKEQSRAHLQELEKLCIATVEARRLVIGRLSLDQQSHLDCKLQEQAAGNILVVACQAIACSADRTECLGLDTSFGCLIAGSADVDSTFKQVHFEFVQEQGNRPS